MRRYLRLLQANYYISKTCNDLYLFKSCCSKYKKKLNESKSSYYIDKLNSYGSSSKETFKLSYTLLGKAQTKLLPDMPDAIMCESFSDFFIHSLPIYDPSLIAKYPSNCIYHWTYLYVSSHLYSDKLSFRPYPHISSSFHHILLSYPKYKYN